MLYGEGIGEAMSATRRRFLLYGAFGLVSAGIGATGYSNTIRTQIEPDKVSIKIDGLPASFRGLTIAQLSDMHSSSLSSNELIENGAKAVMAEKPDVIVLTGDFITGFWKFKRKYLDRLVEAFGSLSAPMGIYAVPGNHDFWAGPDALKLIVDEFSSKLGVVWLRNKHIMLNKGGEKIALLGVNDYYHTWWIRAAYKGLDHDTIKILLSHNPDINTKVEPHMRIDLILSGHTHGGQVVAPIIGAPWTPCETGQKYRAGLVRDGERQTYISRGLGQTIAPVRLNCPPEVTLITLV